MKYQLKSQIIFKIQIINIIILTLLLLSNCSKLYQRKKTIFEPLNIVLIDKSRVENVKIKHILKEFLLKGIIDQRKKWLTVYDFDTLSREIIQSENIEYYISFDLMEYSILDIERRIDKILVSVKIVKSKTDCIMASYIESATGKDIEKMCRVLTDKISRVLVEKLSTLQKRIYEVPDVISEPEDSLQIQ